MYVVLDKRTGTYLRRSSRGYGGYDHVLSVGTATTFRSVSGIKNAIGVHNKITPKNKEELDRLVMKRMVWGSPRTGCWYEFKKTIPEWAEIINVEISAKIPSEAIGDL